MSAATVNPSAPLPAAVVAVRSWPDRLSDWINPILIKETRQALKSRQFVATFFLMLISSWMVATFGMLLNSGGSAEFTQSGLQLFQIFYGILCLATFVIVPFGAFRSLQSERDQFTFEVLVISTLSPRQIVLGKLLSAVLQIFIYYSAITPFIAFTYQLRGVDVMMLMFDLIVGLLASLMLTLIALTVSTLARQRGLQILLTLATIVELLIAFFVNMSYISSQALMGPPPFDRSEFWWTCLVVVSYYVLYFWLLLEVSVSQITFESDNRSTPIRLCIGVIFWASAGWLTLLFNRTTDQIVLGALLTVFIAAGFVHWVLLGVFAVTEPLTLSRRTVRKLRGGSPPLRLSGLWSFYMVVKRIVLMPLLPGGGRGLLYVLGHLALHVLIVTMVFQPWLGPGRQVYVLPGGAIWTTSTSVVVGAALYAFIYLGAAALLCRLLHLISGDLRASHARVFIVLAAAFASIFPNLIALLVDPNRWWISPTVLFLIDPNGTLRTLWSDSGSETQFLVLWPLAGAAVLLLLANTPTMLRGALEVFAPGRAVDAPRESAAAFVTRSISEDASS